MEVGGRCRSGSGRGADEDAAGDAAAGASVGGRLLQGAVGGVTRHCGQKANCRATRAVFTPRLESGVITSSRSGKVPGFVGLGFWLSDLASRKCSKAH